MTAGAGNGVDELLEQVSHRWAAAGEQPAQLIDTLLETLASVLGDRRDACYVSTPITTGPEFVAWWRSQGSTLDRDDPAYQDEVGLVVRRNIEAVRPLVRLVERSLGRPVIDPTRLGPIAAWEQPDYHEFWVRVIQRFVGTVVFAEGWQYSSGCSLEFAAAVAAGLPALDASLQPMPLGTGLRLLDSAARELDAAGLSSAYQRRAIAEVRSVSPEHADSGDS
ncbi:MAG TPA: hypothetical protein VJ851_17835 [Jatrophihabitans sp.]|nr:hypothetical protein [Jatrophihabitans sp.]